MFVSNNIYVIKLQCFGHLMRRVDSLEKTLMLGGIGGRRRRGLRGWDGWMASPTRWTWVWVNSGSWWWTRRPGVCAAVHEVTKSWTQLSNWTELNWTESNLQNALNRQRIKLIKFMIVVVCWVRGPRRLTLSMIY